MAPIQFSDRARECIPEKNSIKYIRIRKRSSINDYPAELNAGDLVRVYESLLELRETIEEDIDWLKTWLPSKLTIVHTVTSKVNPSEQSKRLCTLALMSLSTREKEILSLFSKGFSYGETADVLGCKISTIQTLTKRVYKKLGVHSRSEAVFEAVRLGVLNI